MPDDRITSLRRLATSKSRELADAARPERAASMSGDMLTEQLLARLEGLMPEVADAQEKAGLARSIAVTRKRLSDARKPEAASDAQTVSAVIEHSRAGMPVRDIAATLGIPLHHVVGIRGRLGLGNARAAQARRDVARLNAAGLNDGQIARKLGLSRPHVCNIRNRLSIAAVPR